MVGRGTIFRVFARSFFIQTSWNYGDVHGLGFAAAIAPALSAIYKDEEPRREARKRHLGEFNIHPYMSAPVLGAVIKMEEEVCSGKRDPHDIIAFKKSLSGPFSAIGDSFFWGSVRPLASIAGVCGAIYFETVGPVVLLLFYNLFHLWMRWFGLVSGYQLGVDVVVYIKELEMLRWVRWIRYLTVVLLAFVMTGYLLQAIPVRSFEPLQASPFGAAVLILLPLTVTVFFLASLLRRGFSIAGLVFLMTIPMTIAVLLGGIWLF